MLPEISSIHLFHTEEKSEISGKLNLKIGFAVQEQNFAKKRTVSGRFSLSNLHRFATKLCERASLNSLRLKNAAIGCEMHLIQAAIKNNIQLQFYKHPRMPTFVGRLKKCCFNEEVFLSIDNSWLVFLPEEIVFYQLYKAEMKMVVQTQKSDLLFLSLDWMIGS